MVHRAIREVEFVIFDTETTGLDPQAGDRIVEIAAVRFKGRERLAAMQSLVNPQRMISPAAFAVNQITSAMLKDAPTMERIMPNLLDFIQGSCLCCYNAGFDLEFLNQELKLLGQEPLQGFAVVDILKIARRLLPRQERYALWFIAEKLGVKSQQQHRAFADVEMTWEVFAKFQEMLAAKGIADYRELLQLFGLHTDFHQDSLAQKIASIQEAIDLGLALKIKYLSGSSVEVTERKVIPKEIRQENGRSYLVGYCCLRQEERTFRADGILHLQVV